MVHTAHSQETSESKVGRDDSKAPQEQTCTKQTRHNVYTPTFSP